MVRSTRWYAVFVGGCFLAAVSAWAAGTIIKQRPPSLLRQCTGDTLVLTVQAEPPLGESGLQYQWYKDGSPLVDGGRISGAQTNTLRIVNITPADAGVYTVVVTTVPSGATEDAQTQVEVAVGAQITQQPSAQTVCAGDQLSLSIEATGSIDGYQWYHDGNIVPGATESTFTKTATPGDAGEWWCVVISPCGNVISEKITVQVNVAPEITSQSNNMAVCRGASFQLQVTATGTGPLQYQWYMGNTPISGANQPTYQGTATQTATYFVEVSNSCGTVRSQPVTVRVKEPPQITQQSQSQTVAPGARVDLSVQATGEPPLSYQWYRNGVPLPGATDARYVIANASTSDEGTYICVVTNECGADTSDPIVIRLTGIVEKAVGSGVELWAVMPHPVSGVATLRYRVFEGGWLRLSLADLYGRPVAVLVEGFVPAGEYSYTLDVDKLGIVSGTYVYQLETSSGIVRQLMVVTR